MFCMVTQHSKIFTKRKKKVSLPQKIHRMMGKIHIGSWIFVIWSLEVFWPTVNS